MQGSTCASAARHAENSDRGVGATAVIALKMVWTVFAVWHDRVRYRRALARMSERELADIGVNWSEIANEASKPFWRE